MCFSNLPVEFDDEGNPRLVESEEETDGNHGRGDHRDNAADHDHGADRDHGRDRNPASSTGDDGLDAESRYREILEDLPDRARERIDGDTDDGREGSRPIAE